MSLVAHEFYTSLSKYVITNFVFDRWMDECTERADYKPYSFSKLFTAVYLVHNIETVKCNQHKVFLFWKCPCRDRCDRNPTYIFRYLNPIPTKGADSANHCRGSTKKFSSRYIRYTCQNVYGAKISMPKCLLPKC